MADRDETPWGEAERTVRWILIAMVAMTLVVFGMLIYGNVTGNIG